MIDPELLNILACPACQGEVKQQDDKIICRQCGRKYPIKQGVPVLLIDEALEA